MKTKGRSFFLFLSLLTLAAVCLAPLSQAQTPEPSSAAPSTEASAEVEGHDSTEGATKAKPPVTQKTLWLAHILRERTAAKRIEGLSFNEQKVPVALIAKDTGLRPMIEVRGHFQHPGWILYGPDGTALALTPSSNEFHFYAYLNARINEAVLKSKNAKGEVQTEHVYLFAPQAQEFKVISPWDAVIASVGLAGFSYSQSDYGLFRSVSGILGVEYAPQSDSRFNWSGRANLTVVSIWTDPAAQGPQLFQAKVDAALRLAANPEVQYNTQLLAGINYQTLFSNGSDFGFSNLISPELGLRTRYVLTAKRALVGEIHYVALTKPTSLSEYGLDFDLKLTRILENSHRFQLDLSYSTIRYKPDSATTIESRQVALTLGYSI